LEEVRNAYNILVGKPEGIRALGRPRRRWEDNIGLDLREMGWGGWTGCIWVMTSQWWASVNTIMNLRIPYKTGNILTT